MTSLNDYDIGDSIGKGVFGKVYVATDKYNRKCAIKKIKDEDRFRKASLKEIKFLKKIQKNLNHSEDYLKTDSNKNFVVNFYGEFKENNIQYLVFEYLEQNLYHYYKNNDISFKELVKIGYQLIKGIEYFHKLDIIHADLKPENIMISSKTMDIKIIDFGSALEDKFLKKPNLYIQSRYYRAPEVLYNVTYGKAIDIWSYACILYELFLGEPLFAGKNYKDMIFRICGFIDIPNNLDSYKNSKIFEDSFTKNVEFNHCGIDSDSDVDIGCDNEYYQFRLCSETENNRYRLAAYNFKYILNYRLRSLCKEYEKKYFIELLASIIRYDYWMRPKAKDITNDKLFLEYKLDFKV